MSAIRIGHGGHPRSGREFAETVDRRPLPPDQAHQGARHRVLRLEELQFLVRLRGPGHRGPGAADRHRHRPDHELQAVRRGGVRLGGVHHARRGVGLADPLPALHRRVGVLHRRLPAHIPRADVRLLTRSPASWSGSAACSSTSAFMAEAVLRLPAALGAHVVLGRAGHRLAVRRGAGGPARPWRNGFAATTTYPTSRSTASSPST